MKEFIIVNKELKEKRNKLNQSINELKTIDIDGLKEKAKVHREMAIEIMEVATSLEYPRNINNDCFDAFIEYDKIKFYPQEFSGDLSPCISINKKGEFEFTRCNADDLKEFIQTFDTVYSEYEKAVEEHLASLAKEIKELEKEEALYLKSKRQADK